MYANVTLISDITLSTEIFIEMSFFPTACVEVCLMQYVKKDLGHI